MAEWNAANMSLGLPCGDLRPCQQRNQAGMHLSKHFVRSDRGAVDWNTFDALM